MSSISIGARHERKAVVTGDIAIDFMGESGARVLATPHLIYGLEYACRDLILPMLDAGFDSVGTDVHVKHLAATPMGMTVSFHAEVVHVDGNRVQFKVEAYDDKEKVASGTHERYVVNVEKFAARVAAKAKGA